MVEFHHPEDDRNLGPIALAREVHKRVMEGGDHDISTSLATVEIRDNQFGGYQFKLLFHERKVEEPFVFTGAARKLEQTDLGELDPFIISNRPATPLPQLGEDIGTLATLLRDAYDLNEWEFAELEAASIGGMGQLTDYEFKYESGSTKDRFNDQDLERAIEKLQASQGLPDPEGPDTLMGADRR